MKEISLPSQNFGTLGVPTSLVEVLAAGGITIPTPIQAATLPDSLAGRDVLGRGRTGSGKTYAFLLPLVARLTASTSRRAPKTPRALILAPTRELVGQIEAALKPLAATAGMYLDKDGNVVKGLSTNGHLAVGVPGTVSGLELARTKYGTMPRAALLAPAIRYAEEGFELEQGDVDLFVTATDDFRKDPATAAIFLNKGDPFKPGQKLV